MATWMYKILCHVLGQVLVTWKPLWTKQSNEHLKADLKNIWRFAITSDLWTHDSTNASYIPVTVHYITRNWILNGNVLATRVMDCKKKAENIKQMVGNIIGEFDAARPNNFFVTDNGANIKAVFQDQTWLSCRGHNINLAVSNTQDKRKKEQQIDNEDEEFEFDPLSPILDLVSTGKEIITRVKRSRIQGQLSTTLKQAVSTRWNSIFVMMKSISKNLPDF